MLLGGGDLPALTYLAKVYDPYLIVVSIIIAIVSSFTAFGTAERASNSRTNVNKLAWLWFGAISLGLGVWAMHFIGMLALTLPIPVSYDLGMTIVSIVPGIGASAVILWAMMHRFIRFKQAVLGGILFAGGVVTMHIIGMSAMHMNAMMHYQVPLLLLSVLSAVIFSIIALQLQIKSFTVNRRQIFNKNQLASATVMGLAISSMHYMAMYATDYSTVEVLVEVAGISGSTLATIIGISVFIVILLSFLIPTVLAKQYQNIAAELRQKFQAELSRKVAITDLAHDAWVHLNTKGEVIGWNKSAETIFGWTKQELIGKELSQFIIPPPYRKAHKKGMAHFLLTGEGPVLDKRLELEAQHKDGHDFPIEISITAISVGESYEFSAFIQDISERKKAEEEQVRLLRELQFERNSLDEHAIVSVTDFKGDIVYANDKFAEISQYSREELLGLNHRLVKSDEHNDLFYKNLWETITSGDVWHGILKNQAKDGSYYWVASTIVPFLDENGRPVRYVSIRTDITQQKVLEQKYELAMTEVLVEKKVAVRANRAKSDFLASMSHELRTPLNAILGFSQLIQLDTEHPISEEHKEDLGYIISSGKHLLSLINNVLDLAKIESGRSDISLESISLADVVNDTLVLVQNMAEQKRIEIDVIAKDLSLLVTADYTRLKQVLLNLLSNAIKYNYQGGHVKIDFYIHDKNKIRTSITDDGIGITKENHHRMFSAFDRLGQETSNIEGTGVGLLVTKNIVELMGGKVGFDKDRAQGATFWFDLALTSEKQLQHEELESFDVDDDAEIVQNLMGKKTILCVEDNPVNQELMSSFLASKFEQFEVHHASSAEQGWDLIGQYWFDLILMDISLPGMDGIALANKVRALKDPKSQVPIIAVSAVVTESTIEEAQGLFEDYITKPIDFDVLKKSIKKFVLVDRD